MNYYNLKFKALYAASLILINFQHSAHAAKQASVKLGENAETVFTGIYNTNFWGSKESVSGPGSTVRETSVLRVELPKVLEQLGIKTLIDAPCGDYNWMKATDLGVDMYIGADIVPNLIANNQSVYGNESCRFMHADLAKDILPKVDAIFCRDCIPHLSTELVFDVLNNFKKSGATYLLLSTFPDITKNADGVVGGCRRINLELEPFNFPEPLLIINEGYYDKYIGVWKLDDLEIGSAK